MDKKKAMEFIQEVWKLEEKYGLSIGSDYQEEIGYDFEDNPCVDSINSYLVITDSEGFSIPIDHLESGISECPYCHREVRGEQIFCNTDCENKYNLNKKANDT